MLELSKEAWEAINSKEPPRPPFHFRPAGYPNSSPGFGIGVERPRKSKFDQFYKRKKER